MKVKQPTFQDSLGILSSFLDFLSLSFQRKVAFSWQNPHRVFQPKRKTWISIQNGDEKWHWLNTILKHLSRLCDSRKYPYPHYWKFQGQEGSQKPKCLNKSTSKNWNFLKDREWIFSGTKHWSLQVAKGFLNNWKQKLMVLKRPWMIFWPNFYLHF